MFLMQYTTKNKNKKAPFKLKGKFQCTVISLAILYMIDCRKESVEKSIYMENIHLLIRICLMGTRSLEVLKNAALGFDHKSS